MSKKIYNLYFYLFFYKMYIHATLEIGKKVKLFYYLIILVLI